MSFHTIRMFPVAMLAAALALPATVNAQMTGQAACPDGVTEKGGIQLFVRHVQASEHGGKTQVTVGGALNGFSAADVRALPEVRGTVADWDHAILYFGVRGYGYPDSARDARSFGDYQVRVQDGDLIHGAWLHVGRAGLFVAPPIRDITFLNLEPSTKHVAQLVVGQLRNGTKVVTNDFVSGTTTPTMPNKPKPVLVQKCFQTPAAAS